MGDRSDPADHRRWRRRPWAGRVGPTRLADEIGHGAHGTVWRAWHRPSRTWVAVKLLSGRGGQEGAWRFLREQRLAVHHPSIIRVLDYGSDSHGSYLITELIPGGTLEDRLTEIGPVPVDLALRWAEQLFEALAVLARHGVVHRDVKPANVMLRNEPEGTRAVLCDFGQAWVDDGVALTSTPGPVGTRGYIAPDLAAAPQDPTTAADVFSLGVTLRRALSGGGVDSPMPDTVPSDVVELVERLVARDPRDRPTATEAAAACAAIRQERERTGQAPTGTVVVPSRLDRPPDPYLRRKVAVGAVLALVANALALVLLTRPDPPPPPAAAPAARVAWSFPYLDVDRATWTVADDGTVFSADPDRGIVYRHEGADMVPIAGGGTDTSGDSRALAADLGGSLLRNANSSPWDLVRPFQWQLTAGTHGDVWLNTGEIWHITANGRARRLLTVSAAHHPVRPYDTFIVNLVDDAGEPSVFNPRYQVEAIPSPLQLREGGVDFADWGGAKRVAHLSPDGSVHTTCDLTGTTRRGRAPDGWSTDARDVDGRLDPAPDALDPSSFVVLGPGDCWVVDDVAGDVAHVQDGAVTSRFWVRSPEAGSADPFVASAEPIEANADAVGFLRFGLGRPQLVGRTPDGRMLLVVKRSTAASFASLDPTGKHLPTFHSLVDETLRATEDGTGSSPGTSWRLSPSGRPALQFVGLDLRHPSPLGAPPTDGIVVLPRHRSVGARDLRVPSFIQEGKADRSLATAIDVAAPSRGVLDGSLERGRLVRGLVFDPTEITDAFAVTDRSTLVASRGVLWQAGRHRLSRVTVKALLPTGGASGGDQECTASDLQIDRARQRVLVLCQWGADAAVVSVRLGPELDRHPSVVVSAAAVRRAAADLGRTWKREVTLGPHLTLGVTDDGKVLLGSLLDEGVVFAVRAGRLSPLTGTTARTVPRDATLERFVQDPVIVRSYLPAYRRSLGARSSCASRSTDTGPFASAAWAPASGGRLVLAYPNCVVVVAPGHGSRRLDTGPAPSRAYSSLAPTPDGAAVIGYAADAAEIWRIPLDGATPTRLAGRRGAAGTSPDGARADGSPISFVAWLGTSPSGQTCFTESGPTVLVRCIDSRGALQTVVGASPAS